MWLKHKMRTLLVEEDGQTTVEYVLMLAVVLTILMQVRGRLASIIKKLLNSLEEDFTEVADHDTDL